MFRLQAKRLSQALLFSASVFALTSSPSFAQSEFVGLGDLAGGDEYSVAVEVSGDGSTVVGYSSSANGSEAFLWTLDGGMVGLGDLAGGDFDSSAIGTNGDGSVVVGLASSSSGYEAFRWTEAGGMVGLGSLSGSIFFSFAYSVSDDGSAVAGFSFSSNGQEAFRWTDAGGMVGLGDLAGGNFFSVAYGISGDGSVVVGRSKSSNGDEAFRWTDAGGMIGLGDLTGGSFFSHASGANADGSIIFGYSNSSNGDEAFRWTDAGGMVGLGDLAGGTFFSRASGASADGSVVIGYSDSTIGQEAFIWHEGTGEGSGMRSIAELLTDAGVDLGVWRLETALDVSDDGKVIIGSGTNPNNNTEAWLAVVDVGFISIVDFAGSLAASAFSAASAQRAIRSDLAGDLNVARHLWVPGGGATRGRQIAAVETDRFVCGSLCDGDLPRADAGDGWDIRAWAMGTAFRQSGVVRDVDSLSGNFGLSFQVSDSLRMGAGFSITDGELDQNTDDGGIKRSNFGVNTSAAYAPSEYGIRIYGAAVANWLSDDITRAYLNGIEEVTSLGSRDGYAYGASFVAGLRIPLGDRASLMPYAGFELTEIYLDAYTETTGPFPVEFDEVSSTAQVARLGAEATQMISEGFDIWGGLAWARQLDGSGPAVSGNMPIFASDFSFAGVELEQDWAEMQLGMRANFTDRVRLIGIFDAASDGTNDPSFGVSLGVDVSF